MKADPSLALGMKAGCHSEERSDEESASRLRSKQTIRFGVARCWRAPAPLTRADHPIWSRALLARSCSSHQSRPSDLESRAAGALLLLSPEQIIAFGVARGSRAPAPLPKSTLRSSL